MKEPFSRSTLIDLATELADRLADQKATSNAPSPRIPAIGRGLAADAGIAIFFAAMLQVREKPSYRSALHAHIEAAARLREPMRGGLFSGIHGLLVACKYAMRAEPRYSSLLEQCISVAEQLEPDTSMWQNAGSFHDYDIITGMAGRAVALAWALYPARARASCDYLVWLVEDSNRWRCRHPQMPKRGALQDVGMAHGLAGILAALAIAAPPEDRYERAVRLASEQLCALRLDPQLKGWPTMMEGAAPMYGTSAWCYGTPGCASALLVASQRCGDARLAHVAHESLLNLANEDGDHWTASDHALCHGNAGNALIFGAAASFFGDDELARCRDRIITRVIEGFEATFKFGYQANTTDGFVDDPNLLYGAAGIGLALITLAGSCDPSWMTFFGIPNFTGTHAAAASETDGVTTNA